MNSVYLSGRLGNNAELKYAQSGVAIVSTSLAVSKKTKDGFDTVWVNITLFDKLAERSAPKMTKGSMVSLEGTLDVSSWKDREGKTKEKVAVVVRSIVIEMAQQRPTESLQKEVSMKLGPVFKNLEEAIDESDIPF